MKKRFLKFKIAMTNISRIIMSFLFVNVGYLFQNSVQATDNLVQTTCYSTAPSTSNSINTEFTPYITCYSAGPSASNSINLEKVFIIVVPIVLVIAVVSYIIIKKKKSKKKKEEVNKEKMTNQGEKDV